MRSSGTPEFWEAYCRLPPAVRRSARKAYGLWRENPRHPSLRFKCIDEELAVYSVRVSLDYRACCTYEGDECAWFFIGPHAEYERLY